VSCPICRGANILPRWKVVQDEGLHRCPDCGFAWFPCPADSVKTTREQYLNNETSRLEYYELAEPFSRDAFALRMKRIISAAGIASGSILDIGCTVGTFLQAAKDAGWTAAGIEPNPRTYKTARERGFTVHEGFFNEEMAAKLPKFDAVHMGDVIEHVLDPVALLRLVRRVLKPGGLLFIATPDIDSFMASRLQIKPREHLVYFTTRSLQLAAEAAGYRVLCSERAGRRRSISSMRCSTSFAPSRQRLVGLLDVSVLRSLIELGLARFFKDDVVVLARAEAGPAN
jgi:2-polyprenyl-3-methyl-5-hydroxy-6-metoxy-1,4-benzoquinol methylase